MSLDLLLSYLKSVGMRDFEAFSFENFLTFHLKNFLFEKMRMDSFLKGYRYVQGNWIIALILVL